MKQAGTIQYESVIGCILGTALGDAMGLPYEGLSRHRLQRLRPDLTRHNLLFGRGMVSDDTEHTLMVAQALASSLGDPDVFAAQLGRRLKRWLLCLPAGTGLATARATVKLLLGFPPSKSGVCSAGNGPAMRSAIIGVCFGHDPERMASLVRASTRITHTDPKAEYGAMAVAHAGFLSASGVTRHADFQDLYVKQLASLLPKDGDAGELLDLVQWAASSVHNGEDTAAFAASVGCKDGVSGYIYSTVPVVLHSWFRHPGDHACAVSELIMCGGDTDTTAAIVGGIVGADVGTEGLPGAWLDGLAEWPCGIKWMRSLAEQVCTAVNSGTPRQIPAPGLPLIVARNLLFLALVLGHGFRRLLPPY